MSLNWLRKLLDVPIPEHPKCETCEALRSEIEHLRYQNQQFMNNLLVKPAEPTPKDPVPITRPKSIPWPVRRAMLEKDDREQAERIRAEAKATAGAAKPDVPITVTTPVDVSDLEAEMGLAAQERESHGAKH